MGTGVEGVTSPGSYGQLDPDPLEEQSVVLLTTEPSLTPPSIFYKIYLFLLGGGGSGL